MESLGGKKTRRSRVTGKVVVSPPKRGGCRKGQNKKLVASQRGRGGTTVKKPYERKGLEKTGTSKRARKLLIKKKT